jgi:protein TonB
MRDPNIFGQCLVDSDPASNRRTRGRLRKALFIALMLEALALAILLLAPLAKPAVLPPVMSLTPIPPYRGTQHPHAAASPANLQQTSQGHPSTDFFDRAFTQPSAIPKGVRPLTESENSSAGEPPSIGSGTQFDGDPFGIPGGTETGPAPPLPAPSAAKPPARTIRRSESVEAALLVHRVDPVYPALAIQIHLDGTVQLHAIIGRDGTIQSLEVLSGHPLLVKSALDAVRQWRYRPTRLNGEAVAVETSITVIYTMHR